MDGGRNTDIASVMVLVQVTKILFKFINFILKYIYEYLQLKADILNFQAINNNIPVFEHKIYTANIQETALPGKSLMGQYHLVTSYN